MNILFDINHPVDVNFFKNAILILQSQGNNIHIIFRKRGKLEKILRYELGQFPVTMIGKHKNGFIKKISSQLHRDSKIVTYIKNNQIDLIVCFGGTAAISSWYCRKPYLAFDDDFEYKIPFYHANWFSTRHIYPDFIEFSNSRTHKYHGFKELAYLHPDRLRTSTKVLDQYSLVPNEYVFVREIANISLNYQENNSILKELIFEIKKKGLKIILSLEDKNLKDDFNVDCIILKEPISDIYSLLYYSLFAVSSGDTVARETALLGVPTIYTGGRTMVVNKALVEAGLMFESTNVKNIIKFMNTLSSDKKKENKENSLNLIKNKWENTTSVILKHVEDFIK